MVNRVFIDWKKPFLKEAARVLAENSQSEHLIDLSGLIVATPGSRAGRRLLELLVFEAEERGCSLSPPQFTTPGALPELLYKPTLPRANNIERQLAWRDAVQELSEREKEALSPVLNSEKLSIQLSIAKQLDGLYKQLAAEGCSFEDAAKACERIPDCHDEDRWYVLESALKNFCGHLQQSGLGDIYSARVEALSQKKIETEREIVLLAASDLNDTVKSFLAEVSQQVTVYVHASENRTDSFDEYGCLKISEWKDLVVEIPTEQISIQSKYKHQAEKALSLISENAKNKTYEDVSCGVMDPKLTPVVKEELGMFGVPVRDASGRSLSDTGPTDLIRRVSLFVASRNYSDFASLVRHADVEMYLRQIKDVPDNTIEVLDRYHLKFLQAKVQKKIFGTGELPIQLEEIYKNVLQLVSPLLSGKKTSSDWSVELKNFILSVYKERALDQSLKDSLSGLSKALSSFQELLSGVDTEISFSEYCSILFSELENLQLPPEGETEAVELLGWLELQLDDAEHLICLGMNEGFIPESVVADPFFPDSLRREIGLLDNDRRLARDKYVLKTLLESKRSLFFVAGRSNARGEPLTISRLLLSCDDKDLADRVCSFYKEIPDKVIDSSSEEVSKFSPTQPEKLSKSPDRISATAFRTYLSCPYRFYLKHILRLEKLSDRDLELEGRGFGTAAHEILMQFGHSKHKDSADQKEITGFLDAALDSYWADHFGDQAHAAVYIQREQLRERLHNFAAKQAEWRDKGWEIKFVEKRFSNVFISTENGNVELRGQIDRVDFNPTTKKWALFDYKTGDNKLEPESTHYAKRKAEWKDLQLPAYLFALEKMSADIEGFKAEDCELGYITLSAKPEETKIRLWKKYSDELQLSAEAKMKEIALKVSKQEFWPPSKDIIPFDDYSALCGSMKFTDFEGGLNNE